MEPNTNAPIKVSELTPDHIIPEKLEVNERSNNQLMGYIRNPGNDQVMIQTCMIPITEFGVPSYHKSYYDTFDKRAHIKLPLDAKQNPPIQQMIDVMMEIDEKFNSPETRNILFGDDGKDWEYQEIVRESEPGKDSRERPPYMKVKLDIVYDTESIRTLLVDSNNQVIQSESTQSIKEEQLYTIDEFCNHVKFRSKIVLIITPCKVWTIARGVGKSKVKNYGISWKAKQILVSPPQYTKNKMVRSIFVQDDEIINMSMMNDTTMDATMGATMGATMDATMGATMDATMGVGSMIDTVTASMGSLITPNDTNMASSMASSSASEDIGDSSDDDDDTDVVIKKPVKKSTKKTKSKWL